MKLLFNKLIVKLLMLVKDIRFPSRQTGGDEWIYFWRLNFLMNWNEKESLIWCKKLIKPNMVVLDIGAHIGYYTRIFSKLVGASGRVFAFEPCSENYPTLTYNVSPKRYKNVTVFNKAVGVKDSEAVLFLSPGHSNHSLNAGYTENLGQEQVEIVSIDSFLESQNIKQVDFVKIDVEGAEIQVLNGMKNIIAQSHNLHILIEYNPLALQSGGHNPVELLELIEELGLKAYHILVDGSLNENISPSIQDPINLLCVPVIKGRV